MQFLPRHIMRVSSLHGLLFFDVLSLSLSLFVSINVLIPETVTHLLSRFGPVESTSLVMNKVDSTCRGYAFVVFESERYNCGWGVMSFPPPILVLFAVFHITRGVLFSPVLLLDMFAKTPTVLSKTHLLHQSERLLGVTHRHGQSIHVFYFILFFLSSFP